MSAQSRETQAFRLHAGETPALPAPVTKDLSYTLAAARAGATEFDAVLYVQRETPKRIVIGKRGAMLKSIGEDVRRDIESLIDGKAMRRLWIKVDRRWSDRVRALRRFGYASPHRNLP